MSLDMLGQLNWMAVIAGSVIYFALGAIWYSPFLFAKAWQRSVGWDEESRGDLRASPLTYVIPYLAYLAMAMATAMLAAATGSDTLETGVVLGLVVGVGYALALNLVEATFDPNKPQKWVWFAITGSYNFIGLMIVAVLVSVWV